MNDVGERWPGAADLTSTAYLQPTSHLVIPDRWHFNAPQPLGYMFLLG